MLPGKQPVQTRPALTMTFPVKWYVPHALKGYGGSTRIALLSNMLLEEVKSVQENC